MSKVLVIRHLPKSLSLQDKRQLLQHFGAEKVWEKSAKRNYVFASFSCLESAKSSMEKLHQLEIAKRRLIVEYSYEGEPLQKDLTNFESSSTVTNHIKDFLRLLNAWSPSVDLYQPPPVHLKYKYPQLNTGIIINIMYALLNHKPFYIQTLHLMNKMSLNPPFEKNEEAIELFIKTFRPLFDNDIENVPLPESEPESEMSSEDEPKQTSHVIPKTVKRLHKLPVTKKRAAAILSSATLPKIKKVHINQEDVFEKVIPVLEQKKIAVVVDQNVLNKPQEQPEVIGELGKFAKIETILIEDEAPIAEEKAISRKELLLNRMSYSDMKILPVFKNYHPGEPSLRLYIKNLAKSVTNQDVTRIYKHYVEHLPEDNQLGFDVRVMQEGKMKGQAFVTFPSIKIAETALSETNGFLLKDKPMVVQFARAANKKSID